MIKDKKPSSLIKEINELGQSIWLDSLSREMIKSGELDNLISIGISGITSNPTIFEKAISSSNLYDSQIKQLINKGEKESTDIFNYLAIEDIKNACDLLMSTYIKSEKKDGFVSIEVNPQLAFNSNKSIEEAIELFTKISRPNVMIKIPGTKEGMEAITSLTSKGINVNVTLLFSREMYNSAAKAYIKGLDIRKVNGFNDLENISSVASFFISRIDTQVDKNLDKKSDLKGKIAIANAKLAYQDYLNIFNSEEFKKLSGSGANVQRLLWASTSVKDPSFKDLMYVENLIGKNTVNTLPLDTILSLIDHGVVNNTLEKKFSESSRIIKSLEKQNIKLQEITSKLLKDGVIQFEDSYKSLINGLEDKFFDNNKWWFYKNKSNLL